MAALKFMALAVLGVANACNFDTRNGIPASAIRSNVDSGQVDIPIRLAFNKGPIPSASLSMGVNAKMNQHLGDGIYRQHHRQSGFEVQGAAVPTFDGDGEVQGIQADLDTRMSHDNKVVYHNGDPNHPDVAAQPFGSLGEALADRDETGEFDRTAFLRQQQQMRMEQQQQNGGNQVEPDSEEKQEIERIVRRKIKAQARKEEPKEQVAGLKHEYFIAIMCGVGACICAMFAVLLVVLKKQRKAVQPIQVIERHAGSRSVHSIPVTVPSEYMVNVKPPSYVSEKSEKF